MTAFIIAAGDDKRFRCWGVSGPEWTTNRDDALHFSRRQDAEAFATEDEDAIADFVAKRVTAALSARGKA